MSSGSSSCSLSDVARLIGLTAIAATATAPAAFAQTAAPPAPAEASAPAAPERIARILVEGNQRIEPDTVLSYLLVQPGDPWDEQRLDLSIKTLFNTGLFADVRLQQRGGDLVVQVTENPIINQVLFEGNRALATDRLEKETQARPRAVFTQARAQQDVQRLIEVYRRSGRFGATVTPKVRQLEQNRVDLIFEVTEGPTTGVRRINFIGNQAFADRRLRDAIATEESVWWRFFSNNDNFDPDRLEFDREQLRKFYTNEGYADFRIVSAVAELTPDQKDFFITFAIDEGEKYTWGDISVNAQLDKLDTAALRAFVPIESGRQYQGDQIEAAVEALTFAAGAAGYAFVDIRPRIQRDRANRKVNVVFEVDEGPRVYIERIDIVGNTRTLDEVVRREIRLAEGDAFNRVLVDRSKNRIQALGFFKDVVVTEKPGSLPDRTVVEVRVEEQPTGELAFAVGFSSQDAYLFDISITERNLRGRGQFLRFRIGISARTQNVDIRFTEPRFMGRNIAAGVDVFSIRQDFLEEASFETQSTGLGIRAGFPLTEDMSLGLRYTIRNDDVTVDPFQCLSASPPLICRSQGGFLTSVGGYTWNWDRRNNPRRPTRGFDVSVSQDLAGLGGEVKYLRTEVNGGAYYGIIENWVASFQLSAGYILGWDDDTVRINDRFFKGGQTFRGFEVAGLGPREIITNLNTGEVTNGDSVGGKLYSIGTLELSFPTPLPEQYGIRGAFFVDVGTVGVLDDIDRQRSEGGGFRVQARDGASLRASAGLSVFWDSPFGPIRFDFSQILRKESYDRTETFRFSTNTQF